MKVLRFLLVALIFWTPVVIGQQCLYDSYCPSGWYCPREWETQPWEECRKSCQSSSQCPEDKPICHNAPFSHNETYLTPDPFDDDFDAYHYHMTRCNICFSSDECAQKLGVGATCDAGLCRPPGYCESNADCTSVSAPICRNFSCDQCFDDNECRGKLGRSDGACNVSTGECYIAAPGSGGGGCLVASSAPQKSTQDPCDPGGCTQDCDPTPVGFMTEPGLAPLLSAFGGLEDPVDCDLDGDGQVAQCSWSGNFTFVAKLNEEDRLALWSGNSILPGPDRLFGSYSPQTLFGSARNGFEALFYLCGDESGWIDLSACGLMAWRDASHDGRIDHEELSYLPADYRYVRRGYQEIGLADRHGNRFRWMARSTRGFFVDVVLLTNDRVR